MKIWKALINFLRKLFYGKRVRQSTEASSLPSFGEEASVDWKRRDVLVGSLGSKGQWKENFQRKYYYVPACYVRSSDLPIRYVAIYHSRNLFEEEGGIRYYGEVIATELMQRWEIPFSVNRNNGQELYYAFAIKEWKKLKHPISIRDEWVSQPRFTNLFLLKNCRYSYELFGIESKQDFRLAVLLRELLEGSETPFVYKMSRNRILMLKQGTLQVLTNDGRHLDSVSLEELKESPSGCLLRLKRALKIL